MSLWRRDIACVGWEVRRTGVALRRGRALLVSRSIEADLDAPLAARLGALAALLAEVGRDARRAEFVVSDRHARYFLIERPARLRGLAELEAVIAQAFEALFGQSAAEWHIAWDLGVGAAHGVACALPAALTRGLSEVARAAGMREVRIETFTLAALRAHAATLPGSAWVATRADDSVTLGRHVQGRWRSLRTLEDQAGGALAAMVARERLRLTEEDAPDPLLAIGDWRADEAGATILGAGPWPGQAPGFGARFRVALAGARP